MARYTYGGYIDHLFRLNTGLGVKLGLDRMRVLAEFLGNPQKHYHIVHVAGTNGKGSVTTKVASALQQKGLRVGLYTSPHISSFRERIRINGEPISEEAVVNGLDAVFEHADAGMTFFEATTALALLAFREAAVDWVVLETGLGGRLDATNIVDPSITAITSISLDHTDILGATLEKIAGEKAGILKPGIPVVLGPYVDPAWIAPRATALGCPMIQVAPTPDSWTDSENSAIARALLTQLNPQWAHSDLSIRPSCRFERMPAPGVVILDVAHNPDGIQRLLHQMTHVYGRPIRAVVGMSANKDKRACLELLQAHCTHIHLLDIEHRRLAAPAELQQLLTCPTDIVTGDQLPNLASRADSAGESLLVCGSFFIMASVRKAFGIDEPIDSQDVNEFFDSAAKRVVVSV